MLKHVNNTYPFIILYKKQLFDSQLGSRIDILIILFFYLITQIVLDEFS